MLFLEKEALTQADLSTLLWQIMEESYPEGAPWTNQALAEHLTSDVSYYLLALEENEVCGFVQWQVVCDEAEILNLAVGKNWQRKGIAEKLLKKSFERLTQQGVQRYFLEVRKENLPAIYLYKKLTFKPIAVRKNYYQHPIDDALVMEYIESGK